MKLLLIGTHAFLDRKLFTSEISENFHKFPFGIVIASLRVSGYPEYIEIDILYTHCISSSSCSTIGITLVSLVTL